MDLIQHRISFHPESFFYQTEGLRNRQVGFQASSLPHKSVSPHLILPELSSTTKIQHYFLLPFGSDSSQIRMRKLSLLTLTDIKRLNSILYPKHLTSNETFSYYYKLSKTLVYTDSKIYSFRLSFNSHSYLELTVESADRSFDLQQLDDVELRFGVAYESLTLFPYFEQFKVNEALCFKHLSFLYIDNLSRFEDSVTP